MDLKQPDRRKFLKKSALLAGWAAGAAASPASYGQEPEAGTPAREPKDSHAYGDRSRFENSARMLIFSATVTDSMAKTPLQDSVGIITPSPLHFWVTRFRAEPPDIDPRQHRLMIHGMVDRPLIFTLEELKRLPSVSRVHFVECAGNTSPYEFQNMQTVQQTHGLTSCSEWTGVLLSLLLKEAGVQQGASWVIAESADAGKHSKSIPLEKVMDDALVAYGQNGEAVRREQGYPLRLVVPGFEGLSNVKWLRRIKVVDQPYLTKTEAVDYAVVRPRLKGKALWYNFRLGPKSVITGPSGGQRLPGPGFYEITGLAWSGGGAIRRVEVSTDGGRSWKDANLQEPIHRIAHTRFRLDWNWNGEETVLQSRCTDERGEVQPAVAEIATMWGVTPEYFTTSQNRSNHFNAILPWKITPDGSIHNAMFS